MSPRNWVAIGALYGFVGVGLSAFGAHALKSRISPEMLAVYKTGIEFHFYHALALILLGLFAATKPSAAIQVAGACFAVGIAVFSGSLYALALSGVRIFGAVPPIGGLLFLIGWGVFAWCAWRPDQGARSLTPN